MGGQAAVGKMAYQSLRLEYLQIPPVSRAYTTACVLTTAAVVSSCSASFSYSGLGVTGSLGNGFGPRESLEGLGSRVGGSLQGSLWGSELAYPGAYPETREECWSMRGEGTGLRISI